MKPISQLFLLLLSLVGTSLKGQDTLTIHFGPTYQFINEDSYGFMKLIENHSNEFQYGGETFHITFPERFFVKDTALGFNYFTGWENSALDRATAFLFGNYSSHLPLVYVDFNHNLDFSDDGQSLSFGLDSTLTVYLPNSSNPSAFFPIKFFYQKLSPESKARIEPMFSQMGPEAKGNRFVGIDYWLEDRRKNYKITHSYLNGQQIKIGLFDYNCNGLYNDVESDRVLVGSFEGDSISGNLAHGAVEYLENVQVPIAGEIYEVIEIEATGQYIKLTKSNRTYHPPLGVGDYVGDLEIELVSGKKTTLSSVQTEGRYLLLDFWGSWCKGCTQQLPDLKTLASTHPEQIQILGLNFGDTATSLDQYLSKYEINWENAIASQNIMETLRIDGFPTFLLIDPEGKIEVMNGMIHEIENRF